MIDAWNKHAWRREVSWWDNLAVDLEELQESKLDVFEWLESVAPNPYEHDYILYTDGSGCSAGWGGYAALWRRIELVGQYREPVSSGAIVNACYGSTVQRCEFNALLDGIHAILTERCREIHEQATLDKDDEMKFQLGTRGALNQITGPERLSILWYTDRSNLAKALLFDTEGEPLQARSTDRDLWMRFSQFAKHVCITPSHRPRNSIEEQAVCDELAGIARSSIMAVVDKLSAAATNIYPTQQWQEKKPQSAAF